MNSSSYPRDARLLLRKAVKASLATIDKASGAPYASLIGIASHMDARPIMLISTLARHTQNLEADPRASVLVEAVDALGDGLAEGRATIMGSVKRSDDPAARARYLARHPDAAGYAGFADFAFYEFDVSEVHIVQGFGRINTMTGSDFVLPRDTADVMGQMEESAIAHMNEDHADALALYATVLCGSDPGDWHAIGVDSEGLDLASDGRHARLVFPEPVTDGGTLRAMLASLAREARADSGS